MEYCSRNDAVGSHLIEEGTDFVLCVVGIFVVTLVRVQVACLRGHCLADAGTVGDGVVVDEATLVLEGFHLVLLVDFDDVAPVLNLVDGKFYLVVGMLVGAVNHDVTWASLGLVKLGFGPVAVAIGAAPFRVTLLVFGVVFHHAWHSFVIAIFPVVAIHVLKTAADDGLPVGNEGLLDIFLRIGKVGAERFAQSNSLLGLDFVGAIRLLVDA